MNLDDLDIQDSIEQWMLTDYDAAVGEFGEEIISAIAEELGDE